MIIYLYVGVHAQYLLYGPLIGKSLLSLHAEGIAGVDWCSHILVLFGLRALTHQLWSTYTNMLFLNRAQRINRRGVDFKQIDAEWHWYGIYTVYTPLIHIYMCVCVY